VPLLEKNAKRTEDERRIAGENIAAIEQAELFKMMQPKRFAGLEVEFRTTLEVTRELARGCGSTSWTTNLINIDAFVVGMCNEQMQQDVWGERPNNRVAGALGPTGTADVVDGGYRVSGRWQFCSGCLHAQWVLLGVAISDDEGEPVDQGIILAPVSDVAIEDTWFVTGMRGTGSNTVVADAIFVPAHRYVSALKLQDGETDNPHKNEVLYRAPFAAGVTVIHAGPHLGLARAALDFVIDNATKRGIAYTFYDLQANAPTVQLAVARAASLIDTAELLSYRVRGRGR
jgi:3-hydroxy-9,10-secoandrosta-1,3,5(10)-triene-9,17-dione monooxygenase